MNPLIRLAINYCSVQKEVIVSAFLQLMQIIQCDAVDIACALETTLQSFGLNLTNVVGIDAENSRVIYAINNSVFAELIRQKNSCLT